MFLHRIQNQRIDHQEQQRNSNVAHRAGPGLDEQTKFVELAGRGGRFDRDGLEGKVFDRQQISALIVNPDRGARKFFNGCHFFGSAFPADGRRLALFLLGIDGVIDQDGRGNAAHAARRVQDVADILADREGGTVRFRTLVVDGRQNSSD